MAATEARRERLPRQRLHGRNALHAAASLGHHLKLLIAWRRHRGGGGDDIHARRGTAGAGEGGGGGGEGAVVSHGLLLLDHLEDQGDEPIHFLYQCGFLKFWVWLRTSGIYCVVHMKVSLANAQFRRLSNQII